MKTETLIKLQRSITTEPRASIFTVEQTEHLAKLKQWKPYCIVWGAVNTNTMPHEFEAHCSYDRRKLNSYLRKGWLVATIG